MPAFLASMIAGISGFSSRGARKMTSTPCAIMRVDVGDLLGGRAGGVGVDELLAALRGLVLHARGLRRGARDCCSRSGRSRPCRCPSSASGGSSRRPGVGRRQGPDGSTAGKCQQSSSEHHMPPVLASVSVRERSDRGPRARRRGQMPGSGSQCNGSVKPGWLPAPPSRRQCRVRTDPARSHGLRRPPVAARRSARVRSRAPRASCGLGRRRAAGR